MGTTSKKDKTVGMTIEMPISAALFRIPAHAKGANEVPDFDSDIHVTGQMSDKKDIAFIQSLIDKHASNIIAYFLYEYMPGHFSLEFEMQNGTALPMLDDLNKE